VKWLKEVVRRIVSFLRNVGEYELMEMGLSPLIKKEDTMSESPKKPRVARAPKVAAPVELLRLRLDEGQSKKLFRMLDQRHSHMNVFTRTKFGARLAEDALGYGLPDDANIGFEIPDVLHVTLVVTVPAPEPAPKVKVPRAKKTAVPDTAAAPKAKRAPKKVVADE
jgi:hypothetical protein